MTGLSIQAIHNYIDTWKGRGQRQFHIEEVRPRFCRVRLKITDQHLRQGGTVAGPALMGLADASMYFALLAELGEVFGALTSNLNINFLRRPAAVDVIADVTILRVGKRMAFGDILLFSAGEQDPVAHATCSYSLPPGWRQQYETRKPG